MRFASTFARFCVILALAVWYGGRLCTRLALSRFGIRSAPAGHVLGEELARLCERLGATFIKLGQILSSRPDLLSHEVTSPLARLQDDAAPFAPCQVPALIEETFGHPLEEIFESFDLAPAASASIAHVHRARLHDGRLVAVKIRRPGIARRVEQDFRLMRFFARSVAWLPPMRPVPFKELIGELETPIRQQLDFGREAANLRRFRANFAGVEHVTLPALVEELCRGPVLTMELLEGLQKVTNPGFNRDERRTAALAGLRALYKMIFLDGFVHADMHPGNVFLRRWGEIVLLDAGLVAELEEKDLKDFTDFFFGLVNNQGEICARILWDGALWRSPHCDRKAFEAAIRELVGRHSALQSQEFEVSRFVFQLIETQRRFGIRGSTKFIMTVLSMVVYDGICKLLYPDCDFQREARGYLITARYRRPRAVVV